MMRLLSMRVPRPAVEAALIERLADDGAGGARGLQRAQVVEAGDAARRLHGELGIERVDFPIERDIRPGQQAVAGDVGAEQMAQIRGAVFVDHLEQRLPEFFCQPCVVTCQPASSGFTSSASTTRSRRKRSSQVATRPGLVSARLPITTRAMPPSR